MSGSSSFISDIGKRVTVGHHYFVIDRVIAEGGYGVVFLVRDGAGRKFALKRMYVNEESRLADCKTEIAILSSLAGYKNIIKYVDSSIVRLNSDVNEVLILTHYYPVTCAQVQEESGVLVERDVFKIFCDMCEALSVLHHSQIPIIHRDMKLENILRDNNGNYVLCDLGSATVSSYINGKHGKSVRELEEEFYKHTTVSHRAPEIVDFYANQNITTKIDIWALGVTLYRLCFNNLPFGESTLAIQSGQFTIPEHSTYSQELHSLIYYCLEIDPEKRPDVFQLSSAAFQLTNRHCPVSVNIDNVREPSKVELLDGMRQRQLHQSTKHSATPRPTIDMSDWVETTTVKPRERPKPGRQLQAPVLISPIPAQHSSNSGYKPHDVGSSTAVSVADLIGITSHTTSMTRSLDSHSANHMFAGHTSPFGDDFSQFDLGVRSSTTFSAQNPPTQLPHQPASTHSLGFEDSFADLLIQPTQKQVVGRPPTAANHLAVSEIRGHRRYKSDSTSMITHRRQVDVYPSISSVSSPNNQNSSGKVVNGFEDDFSSFSPSQLTSHTQTNCSGHSGHPGRVGGVSPLTHRKQLVDEFGSESFNPSLLSSSPQQSSWSCSSDRSILPGFS